MIDLIKLAESIAWNVHNGQKRWDGEEYINHPQRVAELVDTDELKIIAWLHDVLEDTNITVDYLDKHFSSDITNSIIALTRRKTENYKEFILRCSKNINARLVKIADLKDNLSNLKEGSMKDKYRLALYILENEND